MYVKIVSPGTAEVCFIYLEPELLFQAFRALNDETI